LLGSLPAHAASHQQTVLAAEATFFNQRSASVEGASHLHVAPQPGQLTVQCSYRRNHMHLQD
jgi:hypothetical protein